MSSFVEEFMLHTHPVPGSFHASRREFLRFAFVAPFVAPWLESITFELHLLIVCDGPDREELRGVRMSLAEARQAAGLLGHSIVALEVGAADVEARPASAIIAVDVGSALPGMAATFIDTPIIHIGEAPPGAEAANLWHLGQPSWDSEAERFGAGQLNARFRAAYDRPMSPAAWAGWLAVKIVWEAAARARSADGSAIQAFLASPRAIFDGHKGVPLQFDPRTHTLR